jgi:hypothetical protein
MPRPLPTKPTLEKSPGSTCIAFMSFTPWAASFYKEQRPGSTGYLTVIFRRAFPRYKYTSNNRIRYDQWVEFCRAPSKGKYWNRKLLGQLG